MNDGTNILLSAQEAMVIRHTMVLSYDNRREFALTYAKTPLFQPQIIKPANSR